MDLLTAFDYREDGHDGLTYAKNCISLNYIKFYWPWWRSRPWRRCWRQGQSAGSCFPPMECTFPHRLWNKSENRKVKVKSNNLFRPKDACINNIPGRKSNHAKCKSTWCSWTQRMSEIKQNLKLIGFLWPRSALFNQCGRWDGKLLEKRWVWWQPGGVNEVDDQRGDGKNKGW